jgi:AcrR family transcriptional regulator
MAVTKEKVLEAAITLLNREGKEALTMRNLAKEVGLQVSSLYGHIKSKGDLYTLISEHIFARVNEHREVSSGPKAYLYEMAVRMRRELLAIRDSVSIVHESPLVTPQKEFALRLTLDCISKLGIADGDCLTVLNILVNYIFFFVFDEVNYKLAPPESMTEMMGRLGKKYAWKTPDFGAQFTYGLDVLFAGIEGRRKADVNTIERKVRLSAKRLKY